MKTLLLTLSLATVGVGTSQAEIYRPSIVRETTVLGAVAGALIGGHNNDRWAEGAVIGAAAGALVGVAVDQNQSGYSRREIRPPACPPVVVTHAPRVVYVDPHPRPVIVHRPVVVIANRHQHHGHHRGHGHVYHRHGHRR